MPSISTSPPLAGEAALTVCGPRDEIKGLQSIGTMAMELHRILAVLFVLVAFFQATSVTTAQSISSDSIFKNGARNNYEALDFNSPESTARAFISAWMRRDYMTVRMTFSPEAQRGFEAQIAVSFNLETLFPGFPDKGIDFLESDIISDEVLSDPNLFFDYILLSAERFGALPFKFGTDPRIVVDSNEGKMAVVSVETGGTPKKITISLVPVGKMHWKVDRIILPKFNQELRPWGFKNF